jgi:hypothetical protein
MSDFVFNIAKGSVAGYYDRVKSNVVPASVLVIVAIKATGIEADSVLQDYDDLATLLAAANDEATNTGYARKTLDDTAITATLASSVDDTNNWVLLKVPDQTWTAVQTTGGAWAKLLICYDNDSGAGTDSNIIPLTAHDFAVTPDGSDIVAQIATNGFFKAA